MVGCCEYVCCNEAGELCAREWLICKPDVVVMQLPNAESAEFSRLCDIDDTDGDFDPVDGGLKNDFGNLRILYGTESGFLPFGFNTESNNACSSVSESWSIRTNLLPFTWSLSDMLDGRKITEITTKKKQQKQVSQEYLKWSYNTRLNREIGHHRYEFDKTEKKYKIFEKFTRRFWLHDSTGVCVYFLSITSWRDTTWMAIHRLVRSPTRTELTNRITDFFSFQLHTPERLNANADRTAGRRTSITTNELI